MTTEELVRVAHEGAVSTLTMNRPAKLNALDPDVLKALLEAVEAVGARAETRVAILTGAGKAFVAGADISAMTQMAPAESQAFATFGHRVMSSLEQLRVPVVAAVNGFALGGGLELALSCDFIHVSQKAKLGLPEVSLGIIPGFGGTQRLPRRVGIGMARELVYTGRMIGADEALRIGLANAVHAPEELMDAVQKVASEIVSKGPLAISAAKAAMRDGEGRPLPEANQVEIQSFAGLFGSADQREGMTAFVEKRKANFTGA